MSEPCEVFTFHPGFSAVKNPALTLMTRASRIFLSSLLAVAAATSVFAAAKVEPLAPAVPPPPIVWETPLREFSDAEYASAVERILADYEKVLGKKFVPGERGRVGLKIYADSGPGLSTSPALVRAVIGALQRRGFSEQKIFLVGMNQLRLRLTGFLPALSTGMSTFSNHPVYVLESGRFYDSQWFYDSPLPARFGPGVLVQKPEQETEDPKKSLEQDRKSFLATPLFLDADFWINLPAYTDHPTLGVNGALVNATLWNASNTQRFFKNAANAPAAVAEMAAIPELRERCAITIASLERYQFIGGPFFNSLYTFSEPRLWASPDQVALDTLMLDRINVRRVAAGFQPLPDDRRLLEFAAQLGVGTIDLKSVQWRKL